MAGLPFCPRCGLDTADIAADSGNRPEASAAEPTPPVDIRPRDRAPRGAAIVVGALVITAGLIAFGLLMRPQTDGGTPSSPQGGSSGPDGSPAGPTAPIVGLKIESPPEGQTFATREVAIIGVAPPGLTITRDVSLGLDQHATADSTGHWAIYVELEEGENELVFRIGDDRSTELRLRVTYEPPHAS